MTAYIIFTRERSLDEGEMAEYRRIARDSFGGHEAKMLAAYGRCETLEGPEAGGAVILEFPTFQAAKAWYDSPQYVEARRHRQLGADYRVLIVEGK